MSDPLELLKRDKPPLPRAQSRQRAIDSALQAFHAHSDKEDSVATQGKGWGARLTGIATRYWRTPMHNRLMNGTAIAAILVLPMAGYVTWMMFSDGNLPIQTGEEKRVFSESREPATDSKDREVGVARQQAAKQVPAGESLRDQSLEEQYRADETAEAESDAVSSPNEMAAVPAPSVSQEKSAVLQRGIARQNSGQASALMADRMRSAPIIARSPVPPVDAVRPGENRDRIESFDTNGVIPVAENPVSTFSADVDTSSYAFTRRALLEGRLPDPQSVRVEELVNYFPYDWQGPESAETPFRANVTITPTPWNEGTKLLHIAVKGYELASDTQPPANLVFLIDVSGSMDAPDKLPLLKSAFRLLIEELRPQDTVSIVTYAGNAGTVLEPTKISEKSKILAAMDRLEPGGSTAGAAGIEEAYRLAESAMVENGVNRVMLATDGDFNVGASSDAALKKMIEEKREGGVFLSVFGFGTGNYNDQLMQTLAQNGNGVAAYIDTLAEAEKTLVQEAGASLFPIASDVKFQIEFNPQIVAEYRQIGFETRALKREDFNNDRVDAGEIGSGHSVTAIYEITPVGSPAVLNSALRYGDEARRSQQAASEGDEIAFVKIRAKKPGEQRSELTEFPVTPANEVAAFDQAPEDVRFSIAVAAFGQKLRDTDAVANFDYSQIEAIALNARGEDPYGYRGEFLKLVRLADALDN